MLGIKISVVQVLQTDQADPQLLPAVCRVAKGYVLTALACVPTASQELVAIKLLVFLAVNLVAHMGNAAAQTRAPAKILTLVLYATNHRFFSALQLVVPPEAAWLPTHST